MKIKWKNVIMLIFFLIGCFIIGHDLILLVTSKASLTPFGMITGLGVWLSTITIGDYLYDEMQ